MKSKTKIPAPKTLKNRRMSIQEFAKLDLDPDHPMDWIPYLEKVKVPVLRADAPAERVEVVRQFVQFKKDWMTLCAFHQKFEEFANTIPEPHAWVCPYDWVPQCQVLMNELTDLALDIHEPTRTKLFKHLLPLREKVSTWVKRLDDCQCR
jgi:hypothetical protein